MKIVCDDMGMMTLTKDNGETVTLSPQELSLIDEYRQTVLWRYGVEDQIAQDEDNLCFDRISKEEFIEMCLEDIISGFMSDNPYAEPEYDSVVFDMAQSEEMWRD